jgi:hypothetical protein
MCPPVELLLNRGLFVTPNHYSSVYTFIAILSDRGIHV